MSLGGFDISILHRAEEAGRRAGSGVIHHLKKKEDKKNEKDHCDFSRIVGRYNSGS